jgi:hypothetical protein
MALSILQTGTEDDVKAGAKRLIDVLGKDGGYIMGSRSAMDEANPKLVKVWFDFTKEYGVYRQFKFAHFIPAIIHVFEMSRWCNE